MPVSNDNQDYGKKDNGQENAASKQGEGKTEQSPEQENGFTSDNLKGKKVDADLERETDKPADV